MVLNPKPFPPPPRPPPNCSKLLEMGLDVLGDWDSPVMPVMIYNPIIIGCLSRMCLARGVALVIVAFPASPLLMARVRVCISASHNRCDLDYALQVEGGGGGWGGEVS